jgi:cell wall assembly regulator SMI1
MTLQTLINAWNMSGQYQSINSPVTEAEIQAAEAKIGVQLPPALRAVYPLFNGGWALELCFFPSNPRPNITR